MNRRLYALYNELDAGAYAELYVAGNTTAASVPAGSTFTKVSPAGLTLGNYGGCTPSVANANVTITKAGKYEVCVNASSQLATTDVIWDTAVFVNGVEATNLHMRRRFSTSGYTFNIALAGIAALSAGDVIDVRSKHNNAASVSITVEYVNFHLRRIGS